MSDLEKNPKEIDLDEEAEFLSAKVGCTLDEANLFLDNQMSFFEEIGLARRTDEEDETEPIQEKADEEPYVLDFEDFIDFVSENSGLSEELIIELDDAQMEYYRATGVIEE